MISLFFVPEDVGNQKKNKTVANRTKRSFSFPGFSSTNYTYNYSNAYPQDILGNVAGDIVDWEQYMQAGLTDQLNQMLGWTSSGSQTTTAAPNLLGRVTNFLTNIPSTIKGIFQNMASFLSSFTG